MKITCKIFPAFRLTFAFCPCEMTRTLLKLWSRFYESSQQRYANVATVTWLARHFETVKFPITSSPRARPSNWANAELYRYKIVAVSLHKTHIICVVKSLVKIAAVSWHSLRRFIKLAPDHELLINCWTMFYNINQLGQDSHNKIIALHILWQRYTDNGELSVFL